MQPPVDPVAVQAPVVPAGAGQAEMKQTAVANLQAELPAGGDRPHH